MTLALVLATQRMARRNVLIRHLPSIGTLGATNVICTDKTGTLTQNSMVVKEILLGQRHYSMGEVAIGQDLAQHYRPFFLIARLCHDLNDGGDAGAPILRGDPMEIALVEMAQTVLPAMAEPHRADEIPFDADRMRMLTVHTLSDGPLLCCKGAPETVTPLCNRLLIDGEPRPFTPELRGKILAAHEAMGEQGLRVLALAYRPLESSWKRESLERDHVCAGLVGLQDPPRPEVRDALRKCHDAGVRVIMTTGDHPRTALAIARDVGLARSGNTRVITGDQLRGLSGIQLRVALDSPDVIFARVAADQKMRIVDALKQKQYVVAVTGDGVNDAPALKRADVGIAMGIMGTDVAKEAADMVLLDDNFASIVNAIEEGRAVFENIRKFLTYILVHNVPEGPVPRLFTVYDPFAADPDPDPDHRHGHRFAHGSRARGGGAESAGHAATTAVKKRPAVQLAAAMRAYLFLGLIEAGAAMAAFFFRAPSRGMVVRRVGGTEYSALSASDHGLLERHHRHADRERVLVPQPDSVGALDRAAGEPADPLGRVAGDRPDPADQLHVLGESHPRDGADRGARVAFYRSVLRQSAGSGGTAEAARTP
ncbi:MAG TPA: HAD-IC family P-type ATPase [Candidatus Methylomirabilis sp.]|nr:HAD-IC family P-type ATPase [Candidatus Methylomirabilis sp.]